MAERTYRIQKAAELSGVPAGLIRAWERRYGALRPKRTGDGSYRAYTEEDVAVLRRLKQLTEEGIPIGDAARSLPEIRRELKAEAGTRASPATGADGTQVTQWQARVLDAAARLDQRGVGAVLDEVLAALPPLAAYEQVMAPLQREVGERWHAGQLGVGQEHLVTHEVRVRLLSLLHGAPRLARRHAVCACLPAEDHEVGLLGAALRFRHAGYRVTYLGPRTPLDQLLRAVRSLKPDLVALSAVNDADPAELRGALTAVRDGLPVGVKLVVGGRAAELHRALVEGLGARVVVQEEDWRRVLG